MIPQKGQILPMDPDDWKEMDDLDRNVYNLLKQRNYSAEQLNRQITVPLEDIWNSLDKKLMRKYIFRKSLYMWGLITEYQRDQLFN
jgi:hypothetical protein